MPHDLRFTGACVPVSPLANLRLVRPAQSVAVAMVVVEHVGQDGVDQEAPLVVVNGPIPLQRVVVAFAEAESVNRIVAGPVALERIVVAAEVESVAARVPLAD